MAVFPCLLSFTQLYKKAQELGLGLCPPELSLRYRIHYKDQPLFEWLFIGMKQITDSNGNPYTFSLTSGHDGLELNESWARPDTRWHHFWEFVFTVGFSDNNGEISIRKKNSLGSRLKNLLKSYMNPLQSKPRRI